MKDGQWPVDETTFFGGHWDKNVTFQKIQRNYWYTTKSNLDAEVVEEMAKAGFTCTPGQITDYFAWSGAKVL